MRAPALAGGALALVAAAIGVTLAVTHGGGDTSTPAAKVVAVHFTLTDQQSAAHLCTGQGGYGDIATGTPVTVKDQAGTILASGSLGAGVRSGGSRCSWSVPMDAVPADRAFYVAEVGHRGGITLSRSELSANDWTFDLSLGER